MRGPGEPGLNGVRVVATDSLDVQYVATTALDGSGFYQFSGLLADTYTLQEDPTPGFAEGQNAVGTVNGVPHGVLGPGIDQISNIVLDGASGFDYNFGELPL